MTDAKTQTDTERIAAIPRYVENAQYPTCVEILTDRARPQGEWCRAADVEAALAAMTRERDDLHEASTPFQIYQCVEWQCRHVFTDGRCCTLALDHQGPHSALEGPSEILAWLNLEQKQAARWFRRASGVFEFQLTGPELMRIRHALETATPTVLLAERQPTVVLDETQGAKSK